MEAESPLNEERVRRVLLDREWATEQQLEQAVALIDAGDPKSTLERCLRKLEIINDKQLDELLLYRQVVDEIAGFKIDDIVGAGAMGVVYLAHNEDGKNVALKVINKKHCDDEEFIKRFQRETQAVTMLQHPNIVAAIDTGNYGEDLYLATEYVNGPSLSEILEDFGPLPEVYVLKCMQHMVRGLGYAYEKSALVHRDIKPPNILIEHGAGSRKSDLEPRMEVDVAKIIDFGLAKKTDDTDHLTLTGLTVGTPHYMAPEQIRADPTIDCRADIYSLGATMYHLLTGKTPFIGNSPGAIMLVHVNEDVPDPSEFIPSLKSETVEICMMCMGKKPDERFANYAALEQAVDAAIAACGGADNGMRVLRKPLAVKSKLKKRKSEPRMKPIADDEVVSKAAKRAAAVDGHAVTVITETLSKSSSDTDKNTAAGASAEVSNAPKAADNTRPVAPTILDQVDAARKLRPQKGSSTVLRVLNQRIFSHKTSAAFDEDIEGSLGVSKGVWLALACSILFMLIALFMRYMN